MEAGSRSQPLSKAGRTPNFSLPVTCNVDGEHRDRSIVAATGCVLVEGVAALPTRELLERGFGDYINAPFLEPDEYPRSRADRPRASPMFANLSAFLNTMLYGFTGIQLGHEDPGAWARRPVQLPEGWRAIHVERIWARGMPWTVDARRGDRHAHVSPRA